MAAPTSDAAAPLSLVGDIVERNVSASASAAWAPGHSGLGTNDVGSAMAAAPQVGGSPPLRPIRAVVGQAFPAVQSTRSYGRRFASCASATCTPAGSAAGADTQPVHSATARTPTVISAVAASSPQQPNPSRFTGLSAHVQPQDAHADPYGGPMRPGLRGSGQDGASEPAQAVGGSAQQRLLAHQWSAVEFLQLQQGFYIVKVSAAVASASASTAASTAALPTLSGEDFFSRLFQCLRSTVRKHQQLALEVLLAHLAGLLAPGAASCGESRREAEALRDRCLHGPNCGPFLFFVVEVLASAGHPAMIELAAACLLLLLRGVTRGEELKSGGGAAAAAAGVSAPVPLNGEASRVPLLLEAIAELGSPPGDSPGDEDAEGEAERGTLKGSSAESGVPGEPKGDGAANADDPDLPFSAVSELLRGADARLGLEQLGFTKKVLAAMQLLLFSSGSSSAPAEDAAAAGSGRAGARHGSRQESLQTSLLPCHAEVLFLELLLCGGVGVNRRQTCRRVAEDPHFAAWVEAQLSAVVLGQRRLGDVAELLCVLHHLAHVPAALHCLLRGTASGSSPTATSAARRSGGGADAVAAAPLARPHHQPYETWLLFFLLVCSTPPREVRTTRHAAALVWSMLFLRSCARSGQPHGATAAVAAAPSGGGQALLQDLSDTLLTEGLQLGGGIVLEMWFLRYVEELGACDTGAVPAGRLDAFFLDAARAAMQVCRTPATSPPEAVEGEAAESAAVAQRILHDLRWTASAHFLATFVVQTRHRRRGGSPAQVYTLAGSAAATQEAVQQAVRCVVADTTRVAAAFARLTTPLLSASWDANKGLTPSAVPHDGAATAATAVAMRREAARASSALDVVTALEAVLARWVDEGPPAQATPRVGAADAGGRDAVLDASAQERGAPLAAAFTSSTRNEARDRALVRLAVDAAVLHASTRLASALTDVYPAVATDVALGFAALLVHAFEEACLRLRDAAPTRLQVDELCTMAEAVQLLQRAGTKAPQRATESAGFDASPPPVATGRATSPASRYTREARVGAFFLLHAIAISKHCLDVVPHLLPLLLTLEPAAAHPSGGTTVCATGNTVAESAGEPAAAGGGDGVAESEAALLESLRAGIEVTPVPVMVRGAGGGSPSSQVSVSGAPRSWALYPLLDSGFAAKRVWAGWLRRLLGLHQRIKDVLGWDAVLSHVLLWTLAHRRELWGAAEAALESQTTASSSPSEKPLDGVRDGSHEAAAVVDLMEDLCSILQAQSTKVIAGDGADAGGAVSLAASRTLEISLAAYSDVPSEEGLPLRVHAVLAYVAAHSTARAALAALQVLLLTPVLPVLEAHTSSSSSGQSRAEATAADTVCGWLAAWSAAPAAGQRAGWSLDDVVSLVQLAGPHFAMGFEDGDGRAGEVDGSAGVWAPLWCARQLTDGCLRRYVWQRLATSGALSTMEKTVLRSTLEELDWFAAVLWTHVCDD